MTSSSYGASDESFNRSVDRARDDMKNLGSKAADAVEDGTRRLADKGAGAMRSMGGKAGDAERWLDDTMETTRSRVRAEPIKMLAYAFGIGAVVGMILRR